MENDSIRISGGLITLSDTLALDLSLDRPKAKMFVPNPTKAVIYSAIFPGLGQIYNRKYWKLPIVYGVGVGCVYAVTWNGRQYRGYQTAYEQLLGNDPKKEESWKAYGYERYIQKGENGEFVWTAFSAFANRLKNGRDNFRRNYELSLIVSVGAYLLCMIDAYVDAHLFEFDISEDLSFKVEPVLFERTLASSRSFGLQWSMTF